MKEKFFTTFQIMMIMISVQLVGVFEASIPSIIYGFDPVSTTNALFFAGWMIFSLSVSFITRHCIFSLEDENGLPNAKLVLREGYIKALKWFLIAHLCLEPILFVWLIVQGNGNSIWILGIILLFIGKLKILTSINR